MSRPHVSPPVSFSDEAVEAVQVAFQRLSPRPYSREQAEEALYNLDRFFRVLERWAREEDAQDHGSLADPLADTHPPEPREKP